MEYKYTRSYKLVVITLYIDLLLEKFQDFKLVVDYDPFKLAKEDIRIYEI